MTEAYLKARIAAAEKRIAALEAALSPEAIEAAVIAAVAKATKHAERQI